MNKIKYNKTYLKTFIIFYFMIRKHKSTLKIYYLFYEKYFDVNANKNDFIEINFKIDLEYEDISERNYV